MSNTSQPSAQTNNLDFTLFESRPGLSVLILPDAPRYTIVAVSNEFEGVTGIKREDAVGKGHPELFPQGPNDAEHAGVQNLRNSFEYVINYKEKHELPLQRYDIITPEGEFSERYWKASNVPVLDKAGDIQYIIHSSEDVTRQVKAEQKVDSFTDIQQAYNFFMHAPVIIGFLKGDDYKIEMANEGLLEVWGKTPDVIGKPLKKAIPELEEQGFIGLLDNVRDTGEPFYAYEYPITLNRHGKDELLYFDFVYKPIYENGKEQKANGVIGIGHDVTAQVLAKSKVAESEVKYRSLFDTMDQGFCVIEMVLDANDQPMDYIFTEINPVFEKETGLLNAAGKSAKELVPDLEQHWFDIYDSVAKTGKSIRFTEESQVMGKWFEVYAFKVGDEKSKKVALLFTDITNKRLSEQKVLESEERFRHLADNSPIFVFIIEADPIAPVSYWNKTWLEYTGQTLEEAKGRAWDGIIHTDDLQVVMEHYAPAFESKQSYFIPAVRVKRFDGEYRWHSFKGNPRYLPNGEFDGYIGVGFDIHEQKLGEDIIVQSEAELQIKVAERTVELQNQKNLFDNILKNSSNGITLTEMVRDDSGKVIDAKTILANDAAVNHTGLTREAFLSITAIQVDPNIFEGEYGKKCLLTLETGEPTLSQYYVEQSGRWMELTISKLDDDHLIHIFTDVTAIKEAHIQLEGTIEELKRSNTNLEEFAYAASHDLKEPIRKIKTFSDRLKHSLQDRLLEDDHFYFTRLEKAADRMHTLINDLLNYSHVSTSTSTLDEFDLNEEVVQVLEDLELEVAQKGAKVTVESLPVIKGYRRQMHQLLQNLISNALKFSKVDVAPIIKISSSVVSGNAIDYPNLAEDSLSKLYNLIEISDNGIGFEQEYKQKIFKMFQRLHGRGEYEGTGIGLAIVRKVVENHKGFIVADSTPGEGATFKVYLPIE